MNKRENAPNLDPRAEHWTLSKEYHPKGATALPELQMPQASFQ